MERIKQYIKENLDLNDNGIKVVELLGSGNDVEKRLLVCIAIDIKFELINNEQIVRVLNDTNILDCKDNLLECYDSLVDKHKVFTSNIATKAKSKLVRVMKSTSFTKYYFNRIKPNGLQLETTDELRKQIERENLTQFYMHNNSIGKGNLVWVTTLKELIHILDKNNETANNVVIRLGLSVDESDNNEFIYIEYPENFDEKLYQPSNFSNNWRDENSLYISYKKNDGFGRTRSRIGDLYDKGMKETVHNSINERKYKYNIKYLGIFDNFDKDISNFVSESINRFNNGKK